MATAKKKAPAQDDLLMGPVLGLRAGTVDAPAVCLVPPSVLSDAVEVAIIWQFGRYPPSAVDDHAIRLRAAYQLVESARI